MRLRTLQELACLTSERHAETAKLLAAAEDALLGVVALVDHPSYSNVATNLLQNIQMRLVAPVFTAWRMSHPGRQPSDAPYRRANHRNEHMWIDLPAPDGVPPYEDEAAA